MRTRPLCGLTLVVLVLHAFAWQLAAAGLPRFASPAAGVRWLALVQVADAAASSAAVAVASGDASTGRVASDAGRVASTGTANAQAAPRAAAREPATADAGASALARPRGRAHAGDRGALPARVAAAPPWPVYATRAPPTTSVHYRLVTGGRPTTTSAAGASLPDGRSPPITTEGAADLEWLRAAGGFSLRMAVAPAGRPAREWLSNGAFDAAGVAPLRLVQRERGRETQAINFDRAAGRVRFSGASGAPPFAAGAQDRWSWVAQLAAIAEAAAAGGRAVAADTRWDLQVAGLRGELERWRFRVLADAAAPPELRAEGPGEGNGVSSSPDRAPALLHVLRTAERPYDLRIEAWLSPSLHHLPAGLRMSTPPGPWSLSLWQRAPTDSTPPPGS